MNELDIIHEDEFVLVINKKAGVTMHHGVGTKGVSTLADILVKQYPYLADIGEKNMRDSSGEIIARPGMVHRLDKETSGVVVIAKTQEVYQELKTHFQRRHVKKEYHAFVYGVPSQQRGMIETNIGKSRRDFRKQSVSSIRGEARDARTDYAIIKKARDSTSSLVRFLPLTGRMHQIRVHALAIQHPIICDARYAPRRHPLLEFHRLALHAYMLWIPFHKKEKEGYTFIAPYPDDFKRALDLIAE
ncbi:MAG: RluA family pseudouridine synthase [Alphaproteobacteria bacterium]|nr:RluA family pseudouridine synthase [Alphaproteobacteria bacterium]